MPPAGSSRPLAVQTRLDDLGTPLADATFVVVDLETTGGRPADGGITEIGAVRVRGGERLATFATLVNPGVPIPAFIASLTGITDAAVASAPTLAAVLPTFLEFLGDAVLVAHNAPYDAGFLKAACALHGYAWPQPRIVDTARLARVALHRDEVANCRLGTLAAHFRATTTPCHRALADAEATVDVLHGLFERLGDLGVATVEDTVSFSGRVSHAQRTKRHLADGLPDAPGVYVFRDAQEAPLYVGTSRSIRSRVRSYFTAAEQRRRMAEMVSLAVRVDPIVCATDLEAQVRELRLIAAEQPRYNRRSRRPQAEVWLKLTVEPAPRLSTVSAVADDVTDGARYLGPFGSRSAAAAAADALLLAFPIRQCTTRIARRPRSATAGCALAELGRCLAPCSSEGDRASYDELVAGLRAAMGGDLRVAVAALRARMAALAADERYEDAAVWRDRLSALAASSVRTHRTSTLAAASEIVAAAPLPDHGWGIHVVRHGRLVAAGTARAGVDPRPIVAMLRETAEVVARPVPPAPAGLTEEARLIARWLDSPGVRLVAADATLAWPIHCGGDVERSLAVRSAIELTIGREPAARPLGPVDARPVSRLRSA